MLQIIDTHKEDSDLCLLAAKTVLKVVNNHQIVFDYQEMAIIKKFNKALDNVSGDMSGSEGGPGRTLGMSINQGEMIDGDDKSLDNDATVNLLDKASKKHATSTRADNINVKAFDHAVESIDQVEG